MKRLIIILTAALLMAGCQFRDELTDIHGSIAEIKSRLELMNGSISSLQTLAYALHNSFYVESVHPLAVNGEEIGYKVIFSNGQEIKLFHAEDGQDAHAPMVSMAKDIDGHWYWTLDDEFILDSEGKKIRVTGDDGKDVPVPVIDIRDNQYVISYDNGLTWIILCQATGDEGSDGQNADSIKELDYTTSPDYVTFTLYNGTVIKVYTVSALETLQKIRSRLNSNILVQWSMLNAAESGGYIRNASDNFDNGDRTGYSIEFNDNTRSIAYDRIIDTELWYPAICLKKTEQGQWIWEIDGKELTDGNGKAVSSKVRPKLMVGDNIWSLSIDNGETWNNIGDATSDADRHVTIENVDISDSESLILSLGNGTVLSIERIPGLYIRLKEKTDIPICAGIVKEIPYEVLEGEGSIEVGVITADLWEAEVIRETERKGVIAVTAPVPYCDENVKVMVSCNGAVIMETLTFKEDFMMMESLEIVQDEITLYAGFSETLQTVILPESTSDKSIDWTSDNPDVAVVSPLGRVVAVAEGETVIRASAQGLSDACTVKVKKYEIPVESINIPTPELILELNTSSHIYVDIEPFNATDKSISWSSSDPSIVEVSESGTIWARSMGEVVITATHNDLTAECKVTVIEEDLSDMVREYTVNGVTFKMIRVKAGTFLMGSEEIENARPVRDVTISRDYFIAETETTQEFWKALMGYEMGFTWMDENDDHRKPAYNVLYNHVQRFIEKLNDLTGEKFRLPTEAEWEYAARGGNKSEGYRYSGSDDINEVAWWGGNSQEGYTHPGTGFPMRSLHPVKQKKPNELGLYDMTGNINEWCSDWYQIYPLEPETDPTGSNTEPDEDPWGGHDNSSFRVHRGGNYDNWEWDSQVCYRKYLEPGYPYDIYGFRLVLPAE